MFLPGPLDCWLMSIEAHPMTSVLAIISLIGGVKLYYEIPKLHREKIHDKQERRIADTQRKIEELEAATKRDKGFSVSLDISCSA